MELILKKYPWIISVKNTLIGLVVVVGLGYFIIVSAREAKKDLRNIFSEEKSDITVVTDVLATGYDFETVDINGRREELFGRVWELESGSVEEGADGAENIAKDIKTLRIYKDNELNLLGNGDEALYNKNREELKMYGNVHVASEDGTTTLDTETLIWRDTSKEMSCPDPIDIWVEDNHILAEMMFSDKDMEKIDFLGNVSMHIVGIDKENFMTKEGWIDYEDVRQEGERNPDDVINVECEYMHYDKIEKRMECYPYIPHFIRKKYHFYLNREEFRSSTDFKFQGAEQSEEELPEYMKIAESTGLEGFEGVLDLEKPEGQPESVNTQPLDEHLQNLTGPVPDSEEPQPRQKKRMASPDPEQFPGMFPDRLMRQVYSWKQDKKIFSDRLDINLRDKLLKPRFDVYIWAFDLKKEVNRKHDSEDENPSKMAHAIAKETTEMFGDFMNVYWKSDFIDAWGGVEIRQRDKYFTTENMVYSDEIGLLQADGNVFMNQLDGEWLEREGLLEDMTDEDSKEDAKKPTKINADGMISYDDRDYIFMIGNVHVKQDDQNVIADEGEYSDRDDILIMIGNVKYRSKEGERLDADKLTIYTEDNRYIAEGAVKVRSLIPEEYEDDLKELDTDEETEKKEHEEKPGDEEGSET